MSIGPVSGFEGDTLEVNASAIDGDLRVEVLDVEGKLIPGFSREECEPIQVDSVHHGVTWKKDGGLRSLKGKIIKLRFYLTFAKLYAFQFKSA